VIGTVLLRLLRIVAAYLLSALVTGFFVWGSLYFDTSNGAYARDAGHVTFGFFIAYMVALFAALPAFATITLGEFRAWRMWWYYSAAGSLIGLALGSIFQPPAFFPYLGATLGIGSGAIYWALAGRLAGLDDKTAGLALASMLAALVFVILVLYAPMLMGFRF
jgi:hypothetical protein